jgi:hypothetical protein
LPTATHAVGREHATPLRALAEALLTAGADPIVQRDPFHHSTSESGSPATEYPTATHRTELQQSTSTRFA